MNYKHILTIALSLCLLCSPAIAQDQVDTELSLSVFNPLILNNSEVVFKQSTSYINALDPAFNISLYPGGRGANQLVIYTPNYGLHTGTNEFGTEAIVEGNTVTSMSGADSTIPANGIVISGHGSAKNWITQNINPGSKVYVDIFSNTITVYTTSESYMFEAKNKISEAQGMINYYKNNLSGYNYNLPQSHIQTAQNYLKIAENDKQNGNIIKQYASEAIDEANMAIKTSLPYIQNELKGIWVRPTETTQQQISSTLDKIKENGFNNVFLETYFHGKTIFPSRTMNKYGFTVQNQIFEGLDPLDIWIKEAHKRGIKVHVWFQSFYVGNEPPSSNPTSILAIRPDWGNKIKKDADNNYPTRSTAEHNGYFLDPANRQVQEFLQELITEIITCYKPDGINLDYIRYPNANARNDAGAWGFTEYARNEFNSMYGIDPVELSISDAQWYDWNQYRRDKITHFVRTIGQLGRMNHVYISTVIFPDIASALSTKQQDWRYWSYNNYIDGFTPLFLTYDSKMLASMMDDVIRVKSPQTQLYAGLFVTFMGGASEDLIRQIFETRKMKADGIILFDYAHTTPVYTSSLMASAFNSMENKKTIATVQKKKTAKKETKKNIVKVNNTKSHVTTSKNGNWIFSK
ncbi:family 10 glycosylhydrolase [bacterium]|nr:family 10 glycosylhydrolase [bacterium]